MRDDPYPWTIHLWADATHRATVCGAPQGRTEGPAGSTVYLCDRCADLIWERGGVLAIYPKKEGTTT